MGKLTISIASQHWLQLKRFLLHRLQHLTGFMMILKNYADMFLLEVIKEMATAR